MSFVNKSLKSLGASTFVPFNVTYCISPNEFLELLNRYCEEYLKLNAKFELAFVRDDSPIENFIGHLRIVDSKSIDDDDYHKLIGLGIVEDDEYGPASTSENFLNAMSRLYPDNQYHTISSFADEDFKYCIFITMPFSEYKEYGYYTKLKDSETE